MASTRPTVTLIAVLALAMTLTAQVHYHPDGRPWKQRSHAGPDAKVDGWYYHLGLTGIRVELIADAPTHLMVRHVFERSPASRRVKVGDVLIGAGGKRFTTPHQNGYGTDVFGAQGPIGDFAEALEACQSKNVKGRLQVTLRRGSREKDITLEVGTGYGTFAKTWPDNCSKSKKLLAGLLDYLLDQQGGDGSFGNPVHNTFAPLALLAHGDRKHRKAIEKCARWHARTTKAKDHSSLINWRYMAAAIVLSEYHLATGEKWVMRELQEIHDFLCWSQYLQMSQINPKSKESHPDAYPKNAEDAHGGWGHNPGFEGYGPICMLTGQGALAFALMSRCGIAIDRARHDAAYAFLARGTGPNGYVWYEDQVGDPQSWADPGRTGAAGIANWLSPWDGEIYRQRARAHARVLGQHPESFPDTHGSPTMGMAWAAVAAFVDPPSFRRLMDSNRWWFTLAQCDDGSFYYQPNRDNAGYGPDARMSASAVTAFILTIPERGLVMTGRRQ
ncbi:MAG: DUF6288 domain-containing protein [bacterium]|nr:DUF6288 domain-containing protein [bacterium]